MTPEQQAALEAYKQRKSQEQQMVDETPTQRVRSAAQGLLFSGADELEAFIRSAGPRQYDDLLNEIRGAVKAYQEARPVESTAFEVGGAAIPALVGALFSGGASLTAIGSRFPAIANALKAVGITAPETIVGAGVVGSTQGALTGFLGGETPEERMKGLVTGGVIGAPFAMGTQVAGAALQKPIIALVDAARRKYGNKAGAAVEREIQRLAQERGITADDAAQMLSEGRLLAENKTLRDIVRSYRATGGEAAAKLQEGLLPRPKQTREEVMKDLQTYLAGTADQNILKQQVARLTNLKNEADQLYNSPFAKQAVPNELLNEMQRVFSQVPSAFDEVEEALRAKGEDMFFKIVDGQIEITGTPTIEQAEKVRSAIANRADALWKSGKGMAAREVSQTEKVLRDLIDNISDDTRMARETWRDMFVQSGSFDAGRSAMKASPDIDAAEIEFEKALALGDEATKSFRMGVMSSLRRMLTTGSAASTIKKLSDEDNAQGMLLRTIFPEQNLPEMLRKLSVAKEANEAANEILGQSPTAITNALVKRQKGDVDLLDLAVENSTTIALGRLLLNMMKKAQPELTDKQRSDVVMVLLSRDADYVKSILQDESGIAKLQDYLTRATSALISGTQRSVVQQGQPLAQYMLGEPQTDQ
jgi:hypothetical protein